MGDPRQAPAAGRPLPRPTSGPDPVGSLATPLAAVSRADEITDRLITAIAIGEYLPGARLPSERELAASLRVGRMTVRAAIATLVSQGLLETQRGRGGGSFVREQWTSSSKASVHRTLSARWEVLRDTCEAVSHLQGTIARAAAEKRTDADVTLLQQRLAAFREAESGPQSQRADELLHIAICAAAHNDTLQSVLFELESRVSIAAPAHLWGSTAGMRAMELRALADHENLIDAICSRRPDDASAIALEHARIDLELLEEALQRAGAPDA
ncbi:FadR family transcriptional regulator [Cryobacterium cheniae]|uniref:FadR family transcriptional regulator n=1 Tax=Cryobacterium cheniae TaxID=1259262 RepID=A0A4R8XII8_9MICO|nr:FadR family transcriptional regulator [Cryobacterium cheniae]